VAEPSGNAFVVRKLAEPSSGDYGSVWVNNAACRSRREEAHFKFGLRNSSFGLSAPVIANSGEIVARVGNHDDSPILLYPSDLGAPQAIAGSASFTKILANVPASATTGRSWPITANSNPTRRSKSPCKTAMSCVWSSP
jgi:hypothetical protein